MALFDEDALVAGDWRLLGRGHAEQLVPMIAALPDKGRADRIAVDIGPGSFTGIRVGLAAAKAFGLAWKVPVAGCTSTALVAAGVFADHPRLDRLCVAFDASRGEVYAQAFDRDGAVGAIEALAPDIAAAGARGTAVTGSGAALLAAIDPTLAIIDHPWPRAADVRRLPAAARGAAARPLYIRPPDAKVPA